MMRIIHSYKVTVYILAFLFFIGTAVHELSHLLLAELLFVRSGEITLLPKIHGSSIQLGSVKISQTDAIRRFLIGAAPFLFGTTIIIALLLFFFHAEVHPIWSILLLIYLLFNIGNSMFSSKKDMEGGLVIVVLLVVFFVLLYVLGFRLQISQGFSSMLQNVDLLLLIPVGIDLLAIIVCIFLLRLLRQHFT